MIGLKKWLALTLCGSCIVGVPATAQDTNGSEQYGPAPELSKNQLQFLSKIKNIQPKNEKQFQDLETELFKRGFAESVRTEIVNFVSRRRIVDGIAVNFKDHPWQVALVRGHLDHRAQFCGGSLIASDTILTAAHCIDNSVVRGDKNRVNIIAGTAQYVAGGERLKVSAIYMHPEWNRRTYDHDFAILKLETPSTLGNPIVIGRTPVFPDTIVTVTGWGATVENGPGSIDLLGLDPGIPIVDLSVCNGADSYAGDVLPSMICAGLRGGGRDSCQGDSGGPLTTGVGALAQLVGVVSWGEGCARRLKYGVYAEVAEVSTWIDGFLD